jgi:hypothetical protein
MRLFQITDDLAALDDLLAECGGDISDPGVAAAVETWMAELDQNLKGKVDNYVALITEMRHRAETRSAEAERLANRARIDNDAADWLAVRLRQALDDRGLKKIETERYAVSVVGNGGKAPLLLTGDVPSDWQKTRTTVEPDRERIRASLEAGEALPFATLGERGKRLAIK